ncbi:hypothetical protein GGI24_006892, partial [Coemansia furcata]
MKCIRVVSARLAAGETGRRMRLDFAIIDLTSDIDTLIGHGDLVKLSFALQPIRAIAAIPVSVELVPVEAAVTEATATESETVLAEEIVASEATVIEQMTTTAGNAAVSDDSGAPAIGSSIHFKPIVKQVGLLAYYFTRSIAAEDEDWQRCDALYPSVDCENVEACITHQAASQQELDLLLDELMMAGVALREYPSGCPPPALVCPIVVPMKEGAEPLFVPGYSRSEIDNVVMDAYVLRRLTYYIDEAGHAHANVLIFSVAKPDTDERRIIMDDS